MNITYLTLFDKVDKRIGIFLNKDGFDLMCGQPCSNRFQITGCTAKHEERRGHEGAKTIGKVTGGRTGRVGLTHNSLQSCAFLVFRHLTTTLESTSRKLQRAETSFRDFPLLNHCRNADNWAISVTVLTVVNMNTTEEYFLLRLLSHIIWCKSESESLYNWRSVSQSVLVSSPVWGSWPMV
jgi:hypothetical protein